MRRMIGVLALASIHLAGCTTLNPVPHSREAFGQDAVKVGDKVVIATTMGERRFEVTSATAEQICGDSQCVRSGEILSIQRHEVNVLGSALAVAGIVFLVGAAVAAARMTVAFP